MPELWSSEKTNSAGSATLGDTSWARLIIQLGPNNTPKNTNLWPQLAGCNLPDSQLHWESKTEPSLVKAQHYIWGEGGEGGAPHRKNVSTVREGHSTYLHTTLWLHLASWNLLRIQAGAECCNMVLRQKEGWRQGSFLRPNDYHHWLVVVFEWNMHLFVAAGFS